MNTKHDSRTTSFRASIGFDSAVSAENADLAAVVAWPNLAHLVSSLDAGNLWEQTVDSISWVQGGVIRVTSLRLGRQKIKVTLFVAEDDPRVAREMLLQQSTATMMIDIPYVRGPADLGTLSIVPSDARSLAETDAVMWVFYHIFVDIRTYDSRLGAYPIARALDAAIRGGLGPKRVWHESRPAVATRSDGASVSARHGVPTSHAIRSLVRQGDEDRRYMFKPDTDLANLEVISIGDSEVVIRGVRPGPGSVSLHVIDPATLLSKTLALNYDFQ